MVQRRTILTPADNSGAHKLRVIHLYGGSKRNFSYTGDIVRCVVDGADPNGMVKDNEKKGKVERILPKNNAVVVSGVNLYKRHVKRQSRETKGQITEITKPL